MKGRLSPTTLCTACTRLRDSGQDDPDRIGLAAVSQGVWVASVGSSSRPRMRYPRWLLTTVGRRRFPPGLPFDHQSAEILGRLDVPTLWLVAGADREEPPGETIACDQINWVRETMDATCQVYL